MSGSRCNTCSRRSSLSRTGELLPGVNDGESDSSVEVFPGLDGDETDPIVVCGFSFKFPQEATSPEGLWEMMMERKCAMTEFPPDRINLNGFHHQYSRLNTIPIKGGHFVKDDLSVFDAEFFSLPPTEASSIDPMQRWLLEVAYRALENAGITMENISGTRTAVYTGSFGFDYMLQLCRDPENPPLYAALGFGISMLANRLSWFFNLRGPSIGLDSACSSSAMAIDIACQSLRNGSCDMAMIAGCNTASSPESYMWMSNINFLSPDSRCHSFDHRANGYARGEGVGVVLLKRLSDALKDGNTIRAVIRSAASNEDGRTPGITQPSRSAQERLIKETYRKAGLSMSHTRFFEAHGTGTAIGDPREAQAIGSTFRNYRSTEDPVYVGAVKSNIGHLGGASGLAALVKTILVLEKGIIPPNANFEKLNPRIDAEFLKVKFPEEAHPWPRTGLRRASINSFGYGGANSHIVIDDAYNYLRLRSLSGKHHTSPHPPRLSHVRDLVCDVTHKNGYVCEETPCKLLLWSSADKQGISRMTSQFQGWYKTRRSPISRTWGTFLGDLAYTLDSHRSQLQWRSFALIQTAAELSDLQSRLSSPVRVRSKAPRIGFVFSGQGSQWFAMGRELMTYPSFAMELNEAEHYLKSLGCDWSVKGELLKDKDESNVDSPELSQTLCTVLQVALVNLLQSFGVMPSAVVGHSSGEIAAAYAGGYISSESAWKLAYYRGLCARVLIDGSSSKPAGAMMSVGLSQHQAEDMVAALNRHASTFGICIACINSPNNITVAGESRLIDQLKAQLDAKREFARKLRVPVAYHSGQMEDVSREYLSIIQSVSKPHHTKRRIPMISSVTGARAVAEQLMDPSYWALNMTSPVLFAQAVTVMCEQPDAVKKIDRSHLFASVVDHLLEVGPHATLQGPLREILRRTARGKSIGYNSVLKRGHSAAESTLNALGYLHCIGYAVNLRAINTSPLEASSRALPSLLVDLPEYPFDHSQRYWDESRLSRNYRLRSLRPTQLLGVQSRDWNASEARWRVFIRVAEMPWAEQHVINGVALYPATGMLVMAIEAAKQLIGGAHAIHGYTLRDVHIEGPMDLGNAAGDLEVQTHLRKLEHTNPDVKIFEFAIRTWSNEDWLINCRGFIAVELSATLNGWVGQKNIKRQRAIAKDLEASKSHCTEPVDARHMYTFLEQNGYKYGSAFRTAQQQHYNGESSQATAEVELYRLSEDDHVVHPVSLDAILHLAFTALSCGGTKPMATSIPSRIGCLWVSSEGLSWPDQSTMTACTTIQSVTKRGFSCTGGALSSDPSGRLRLWYEDFELVNITSKATEAALFPNPKQFCMNIEYKVALDKLSSSEIRDLLRSSRPITQDLSGFYQDIQLLVLTTLELLVEAVDLTALERQEPWKRWYLSWAEHQLKEHCPGSHTRNIRQSFQALSESISSTSKMGRLYAEVASNIIAMFNDEVQPLELLLESGLLKGGYDEWADYDCAKQAASYIDLLAHQRPGMNLLEVGGGTGATTRNFTSALRAGANTPMRSLRCNRYDFTDISVAFLEKARTEFADFVWQMTFRTLNIEHNFADQGYTEGSYDIVVADNVLHVTSNLGKTLRNVRKALKPGGKLIMHELLRSTGWTAGFIFGVFPGWWLGVEDDRVLSPNLTPEGWDEALRANGFSGVDMVLRDFDTKDSHQVGWLVATATEEKSTVSPIVQPQSRHQAIVVIDKSLEQQRLLSDDLLPPIYNLTGLQPHVLDLATAANIEINKEALVILLLDYGPSFLADLDETKWKPMSFLIQKSRHLLWVSAGGGREASPDHGLLDGLARTLRSEYYDLHLVTVALELAQTKTNKETHLVEVAREMLSRTLYQSYEQDYTEIDGLLHTKRLVEARDLKSAMDARVIPYEVLSTPLDGQIRFKVSTSSFPGSDMESHYVRIPEPLSKSLAGGTVEILVRAVSLRFGDRSTLLGGGDNPLYGSYCSGTVLSAGSDCAFEPGDRVIAAHAGSFRSHVRVQRQFVTKLPAALSFTDACIFIPLLASAYNAFVEVGRIKYGKSVLVHDGASPFGQVAIRLLKDRGVTSIWTTASSKEESHEITEGLQLSEEHVFPKSWFETQSTLATLGKRKFDIVFGDHTDSPRLLLDYITSGGQYVRFGPIPLLAKDRQVVHSAPENIRLVTIPVEMATTEALKYATDMSSLVPTSLKDETVVLPASELASIFSSLKSSADRKGVVVRFDESDSVDVRVHRSPPHHFDSESTYLIAGGFGGLGRAMARWLVGRGARYLILLSRSGPRTTEARDLMKDLIEKGVRVEAPCCDISDRWSLRSALNSCVGELPPIKGCIQSTMVMTELIFQKMEFQDWKTTVDGKAQGSWNLHAELPKGLDFFILLSSVMGILGTGSLAAYNAGNAYADALAHYRISQGERAVAIDLGGVLDAGHLAEHSPELENVQRVEKHALTCVTEICALLDIFCDPESPYGKSPTGCQAIIGLRPPAHWKDLEEVPFTMSQPFWGHMHHVAPLDGLDKDSGRKAVPREQSFDMAGTLAVTGSVAEAAEIVSRALVRRISIILGIPEDRLDDHKPMHQFGIDSLSAIDIRNWVGKVFSVDMPVFDILGGATFSSASMTIAHKLQLR